MDRLTGVVEHLDGDLADTDALVGNLRDFARLNRLSGGTRLSPATTTRSRSLRGAIGGSYGSSKATDRLRGWID